LTKELFQEPWVYRVFLEDGEVKMAVMMGQSAMYEKIITLTEDEARRYQADKALAKKRALDIAHNNKS